MNDKTMLELAAKAIGWTGWQSKHGYWNVDSPEGKRFICCEGWQKFDSSTGKKNPEPTFADAMLEVDWHPLIDDGDRYRLAKATKLVIDFENGIVHTPRSADGVMGHYGFDAETEARAVVEAAAYTFGQTLPPKTGA